MYKKLSLSFDFDEDDKTFVIISDEPETGEGMCIGEFDFDDWMSGVEFVTDEIKSWLSMWLDEAEGTRQ